MTKEKIESIRKRMCDDYCKFPGWKLNDIGIAERVIQKICEYCPLNELEELAEKTGRWNREVKTYTTSSTVIRCSECNVEFTPWKWEYRYCPCCGARMEVEVSE